MNIMFVSRSFLHHFEKTFIKENLVNKVPIFNLVFAQDFN
jgi:hypothetical protein